jgi:hypothetical protein
LALVAAPTVIVPAGASAASGKQRACYTATTFRAVSGPAACRGAEAYITWAKRGLLGGGAGLTGGTKPKVARGITGDTGAHGPFIATRPVRGLRGAAGLRGVNGESGTQGPKGSPGDPGTAGAAGAAGDQGPQGLRGVAGETGPRGLEGQQGQQGAEGRQGEQGAQGLEGLTGGAGPAGLNGLTGSDGAQGPQGVPGANGANGVDGAQGPQGAAGADGAPGAAGAQGPAGADGAPGAPGAQGPAGADGAAGAQGPAGPVSGFRRTLVGSVPLVTTLSPITSVTPPAGAYIGGATTTVTASPTAASVTCQVSDDQGVLGVTTVNVGADQAVPSARVSVQFGVFTSNSTALVLACSSDADGVAVASNVVLAGLSLDAMPESP